jgi:ribose transport system permease protein
MALAIPALGRRPAQLFGGWEAGLLGLMAIFYIAGALINPAFFGSTDALHALLRDAARYGVMAVGMTFVIANKDLDLSVGSTFGLVGVVFSYIFDPGFGHYDLGVVPAVLACLALGLAIGLINGVLVTFLQVPAFIATLTMLLIGRGFVLGLTGGQSILYAVKARDYRWFYQLGETNGWGFNNQIPIALAIILLGAIVLAKTRWGYETFATGGNEQAAVYAGIPTRWVRIRGFLLSSLCATIAGLMAIAQDKGVTPQAGLSAELIVIASVIIGGASILGGRGRVFGSFLGALLVVLINKVLREGLPITRTLMINGESVTVQANYSLPAGAVPAFIGCILIVAVLIEPYIIRRRVLARLWAAIRGAPPPLAYDIGGAAIVGAQTKGAMAQDKALTARGFGKFLARRDALAIILAVILWIVGFSLRPDYWANIPNTFAVLLNYTEVALIAVGLTYVIAAGDIDLSVGSVLALAGSAAAYSLKVLHFGPEAAMLVGLAAGLVAGLVNAFITVVLKLPSFIATLGMFYIARGVAAWIVAGQQLTGWTERYNLIGRKIGDILIYWGLPDPGGLIGEIADAVSVQTVWMLLVSAVAGIMLGYMPIGQRIYATGGNIRAASYAGINTDRVRFFTLLFCAFCATMAGLINIAYFRSFNPAAGSFRELDGIAAVIIGGGSIFGGYGTIIGALAGAAVITLVRALLQLNVEGYAMPQHWVNVFIGVILIAAVLVDIWVRQANVLSTFWQLLNRRKPAPGTVSSGTANV